MRAERRKESKISEMFSNVDWIEIAILVVFFVLSLGLLLIPKDILYKLSILPFISVI